MLCIYKTDKTGKVVHAEDVVPGCWINLEAPTKEEIARVCKDTGIAPDFIQDALDREEKPRIDWEDSDQTKFVLIDVPIDDETNDDVSFDTLPLGMIIVRDDIFITVSLQNTEVVNRFKSGYRRKFSTRLKSRFVLQIFYEAASSYLKCLKVLNKEKDTVEHELAKTYKNPELLALLNIQKSLVYFETSLKANESVMEKLLRGKTMTLYEDDEEALEDAIIENKQALEMTQIYSNVLESTMDVYGSLISNNLSSIMRFLTSVTIFLAIPTAVAGFWGMNVAVPMQDNPWAFWIVFWVSIVASGIISWLINKRKA